MTSEDNICLVNVIVNTGISKIVVSGSSVEGNSDMSFSSTGTMYAKKGDTLTYIVTANSNYNPSVTNGTIQITETEMNIAPTATGKPQNVYISLGEGVASVTVTGYGTYTSSTNISVPYGTTITWNAKAESSYYTLNNGSGQALVTGYKNINITVKTYTVTLASASSYIGYANGGNFEIICYGPSPVNQKLWTKNITLDHNDLPYYISVPTSTQLSVRMLGYQTIVCNGTKTIYVGSFVGISESDF